MKHLVLLLLLYCGLSAHAAVSVAFFEFYSSQGELIQLEPGGRFFHVAVLTEEGWLHSHPQRGVELVKDLNHIGARRVILTNPQAPSLTGPEIRPYMGLPFDFSYEWEDLHSTYCSKLVGVLLKIEPLPMDFSAEHWKRSGLASTQRVGLSPDDIYRALRKRGFSVRKTCEGLLNPSET